MKVLIVSLQRLPAFGGVNSYIYDLLNTLKKMGHSVEILCGTDINYLSQVQLKKVKNFQDILYQKLPDIPKILLNYEVAVFAFKEIFKSININNFDIIHSQDGILSKAFKEVYPNKPLVGTIHGSFFSELTGLGFKGDNRIENMFKRYDNWAVSYPDYVITPSKYIDDNMPSILKDKHRIINHGVDINVFKASDHRKKNSDCLKICTAGSLYKYKGIDVFLKALTFIKNDNPNLVVDIYGDGPEKVSLMNFVNENQLPVNFKGTVKRNELPEILSNYDVFVQPSRVESFGLSVTEAMASACVPICSAVGGLQDQVKHMENGLLFESENSEQLYQCLNLIASDNELYQVLSKNARKTAEEKFSLDKMCLQTISVYEEAMSKLIDNSLKETFTEIFKKRLWGMSESVSGSGSRLEATKEIVKILPNIIENYNIKSMLDAPCGDFNWMQYVDLQVEKYIGIDIVTEIIKQNQENYSNDIREFLNLDITKSILPQVDLIFCRDCLVHLSYNDIWLAINNFIESGSQYILTTTFTDRNINEDIRNGEWRPLNLELEPFNFPKPLYIINEKCQDDDGIFADKSLALWKLSELPRGIKD